MMSYLHPAQSPKAARKAETYILKLDDVTNPAYIPCIVSVHSRVGYSARILNK